MKYNLKILILLQTKFSRFVDLLLREQQIRKETVKAHGFPGLGKDVKVPTGMSGRKLPNARDFAITIRSYDGLLYLFGLKRRMQPLLEFGGGRNAPANRYINYMFKRLDKQVRLKHYDEAVKTIGILMNSKSYLAACYNHLNKNGHRKFPIGEVEKHLKRIKSLIRNKATVIDYSRVYLHEKNKIRPLGVPKLEWRVYLHMYNNLLVQGRMVSEKNIQHGYLPDRGILTAWNALVKLLDEPNIFEADLKGFFDNVSHMGLELIMKLDLRIPGKEAEFITSLNQSVVTLPEEQLLPERHRNKVTRSLIEGVVDLTKDASVGFPLETMLVNEGVPQGAPTSCSIATLALRQLEKLEKKMIAYADDFITFPKYSFVDPVTKINLALRQVGAEVNTVKSGWIKKDGVWVKTSFKFLGIRCYPSRPLMCMEDVLTLGILGVTLDIVFFNLPIGSTICLFLTYRDWGLKTPLIFEAETRKGAKLRFTDKESLISYLYRAKENLIASGSPGKNYKMNGTIEEGLLNRYTKGFKLKNKSKLLGNNSLTGGFISRMMMNSGEVAEKQNFHLTKTKGSGVSIVWPVYAAKGKLDDSKISVFTASSFAVHDLMQMLEKKRIRYVKSK